MTDRFHANVPFPDVVPYESVLYRNVYDMLIHCVISVETLWRLSRYKMPCCYNTRKNRHKLLATTISGKLRSCVPFNRFVFRCMKTSRLWAVVKWKQIKPGKASLVFKPTEEKRRFNSQRCFGDDHVLSSERCFTHSAMWHLRLRRLLRTELLKSYTSLRVRVEKSLVVQRKHNI